MRVEVFWIGKTRLPGVADLTDEYAKRLGRYCEFSGLEARASRSKGRGATEEDAILDRTKNSFRVVLDPAGKRWTSAELGQFMRGLRDSGQKSTAFCVGGADGFSQDFRRQANLLLSLSALTMPHELARVVLLEQLYRVFTMLANHPYPR